MITIPTMGDEKKRRNQERRIPCWKCSRVIEHRRDGRPTPHKPHHGSWGWCDAPDLPAPDGAPTWPKEPVTRATMRAPSEKPAPPPIEESSRTIPQKIIAWVLHRDRRRCARCGERDGLELHHVKEWSKGGTHDPDNLETLCGACHAEWTWSASIESYEEWKKVPPGRWFEKMVALAGRDTDEGLRMLLRLRAMSALDLIATLQEHAKKQREAP